MPLLEPCCDRITMNAMNRSYAQLDTPLRLTLNTTFDSVSIAQMTSILRRHFWRHFDFRPCNAWLRLTRISSLNQSLK